MKNQKAPKDHASSDAKTKGDAVPKEARTFPEPLETKHALGKVKLVIDEGQTAELHGVVYGLSQRIQGPGFEVKLSLDHYNSRILVEAYKASDYKALSDKLSFLADANQFGKIWLMAGQDWEEFLCHGFVLEGIIPFAFKGQSAYQMAHYRSSERRRTTSFIKEDRILKEVQEQVIPKEMKPLPKDYEIDFAKEDDIPAMLELYREVFESYPSALTYREYLMHIMHRDSIFRVIRNQEGRVVAAASAEINEAHLSAELTDCATAASERGKGLMSQLLQHLEEDLRQEGYISAYTLARAPSFGINTAFHRLGYRFGGRLINNCDIYGEFENMNIWAKKLNPRP